MSTGTDVQRAIACNFMHEPRVSSQREKLFLDEIPKPCHVPESFREFLNAYLSKHIQQTLSPDFKSPYNRRNRISAVPESFISIFIINGLANMFLWAKRFPKTEIDKLGPKQRRAFLSFSTYPNHANAHFKDSIDYVNAVMRGRVRREEFFELVCELYEIYRIRHPYHPIWLTKWTDFRAHWNRRTANKGNHWCDCVGIVTKKKVGQWVIVLRFHSRHLKPVYHPTVLDAGGNPYHFPAPEGVKDGGRAADLRNGSGKLLCEYIAAWPSIDLARVDFAKGCAQLRILTQKTIREVRRHHIQRLEAEFQRFTKATKWLNRVCVPN
jgi:hypothetical protein